MLSTELAKMLKLVAPASMDANSQAMWLASAVESLEGIRAQEVAAVSLEIRRFITRPAQIVPKIAELVAQRRARPISASREGPSEHDIQREAQQRRAKAKTRQEVQAASDWERQARIDAGYSVPPLATPLSRHELDTLTPQMLKLGLNSGFLTYRNNELVEVSTG